MKVFLSSTATDLAPFRAAARHALANFDINTFSVEDSWADLSQSTWIMQQLADSDAVVFIVGHRYGPLDPTTGKSWVELEFEAAHKLETPILVFLASDSAPWPPNAIDQDRTRIQKFRDKLKSNYVVSYFQTPEELSTNLVRSLLILRERTMRRSGTTEQKPLTKNVRILRLLLSSPGDVLEERDACSRAVFRFNQQEVEQSGIFIKLIRWEDMAPQIGPGPQNVINEQVGEYDLFLGIMWNRFGTPTDVASSGTEEEFRAAVESWTAKKKPWIVFCFCERPANFTNEQQLEQKAKVLKFRSEVQTMGVVRTFTLVDELENLVFQDLLKITTRKEFKNPKE